MWILFLKNPFSERHSFYWARRFWVVDKDLSLGDFQLLLHCIFEKLCSMKCRSSHIRLNWFFPWVLKRPFELIPSSASSLFPQTLSKPMRLSLRRENSLVSGSSHLSRTPYAEIGLPCRAQWGMRHRLPPKGKEAGSQLHPDPAQRPQWVSIIRQSHTSSIGRWARAEFVFPCLVCLEAPLGWEWVPRKRVAEAWALFHFLFSLKGLWYGRFSALLLLRLVGQVFILSQTCKKQVFKKK